MGYIFCHVRNLQSMKNRVIGLLYHLFLIFKYYICVHTNTAYCKHCTNENSKIRARLCLGVTVRCHDTLQTEPPYLTVQNQYVLSFLKKKILSTSAIQTSSYLAETVTQSMSKLKSKTERILPPKRIQASVAVINPCHNIADSI